MHQTWGDPRNAISAAGHLVPSLTHCGKTNRICRIFVIVAPFELIFGVCAQFCRSGLLGPFSAHSEHLSYCELGLDDLVLLDFKLEQIRGHFC